MKRTGARGSQSSAYAACEALARSHYENFPVASLLLPAAMRPHVAAVYAFARVADDIADEGRLPAADRRERLEVWQRQLHAALANGQVSMPPRDRHDLVIVAAADTIRSLTLPVALFDDLISAFVQDTTTTRYASWPELFAYCRRSANPVGRLVLRIGGYDDSRLEQSSDALCTALQLTNFWQDFGRDWRAGRLYVPRDVQAMTGASESDLSKGELNAAWMKALSHCVDVTKKEFAGGRLVCDSVRGRLRYELRCTWIGGRRILEKVDRSRRDLLDYRPTLGVGDLPGMLWQTITWRTRSD
jgi:hydroxysqualene synthase